MMAAVLSYSNHMQKNFMLFSELQKKLSFSPIKTWRLLKQFRDEGRMQEPDDCMLQDRKLYVNVPRFIVELEHLGYANVKSDDITSGGVISSEIKQIIDELNLISSEITERSIQEEMKSDDITDDQPKPKFVAEDFPVKSATQNLKSNDITNSNLKPDDFTNLSREILEAKNEVIETLKGSIQSKENDVVQLRAVISDLTQQLKNTTQQNAWLTNLLVAPKQETEPMRSTKATEINDDISDFSDEITDEEEMHQEANTDHDTPAEEQIREQQTDEMTAEEEMQPAL